IRGSQLLLLLTGGEDVSLSDFESGNAHRALIPALIVATPLEWRAAQDALAREAEAGVLNQYSVVTKFLTSSWTVWPPRSSYTSKTIKQMHKSAVSPDEHGVFPNLESILEQAASKEVKPKHKIILVPQELEPILDRLILSRWATDNKAL